MRKYLIAFTLVFLCCYEPNGLFNENDYDEQGAIGGDYGAKIFIQTKSYGGEFGHNNVAVIWIEDIEGEFIKTLSLWALNYPEALVTWQEKKITDEIDGITSASRINHESELTGQWDLRGADGKRVPDGKYKVFIEFTEDNAGNGPTYSSSCQINVGGSGSTYKGQTSEYITKFNVIYNP